AGGRGRPRADDGSARRPDTGIFRRAGGQYLRHPRAAGGRMEAPVREPAGGIADVGGVVRARAMAKRLESDLAIIDKRRPQPNVSEVMNVIGDVKGRNCVIMDDMVDTANTLVKAAQALKDEGAIRVVAYCTHPVLSGGAVERIAESEIDELVVTG